MLSRESRDEGRGQGSLSRESRVERREHPGRETRDEWRGRREFRFERLDAWQMARTLNKKVYTLSRLFPKEEMFGLTSQIRRASVSVSSNIAEGSGRNSDTDFAHFLEIAYGSLTEVASELFLAFDQLYMTQQELDSPLEDADFLAAKTVALCKSFGRSSRIYPKPSSLNPRPSARS